MLRRTLPFAQKKRAFFGQHFLIRRPKKPLLSDFCAEKRGSKVFNRPLLCFFGLLTFTWKTSLLRRLQAKTLSDATPIIGKICPFIKIAVNFIPRMQFYCRLRTTFPLYYRVTSKIHLHTS